MPERSSKPKPKKKPKPDRPPADVNVAAKRTVAKLMARLDPDSAEPPTPEKNPAAVALGRLGGARGGPARAASLSPAKKKAIAKKAAAARWAKRL